MGYKNSLHIHRLIVTTIFCINGDMYVYISCGDNRDMNGIVAPVNAASKSVPSATEQRLEAEIIELRNEVVLSKQEISILQRKQKEQTKKHMEVTADSVGVVSHQNCKRDAYCCSCFSANSARTVI